MSEFALAALGKADKPVVEHLSDLDLVRRTRAGDSESFSELVRRHEQLVYNVSLRYMRDPVLAEDMAQEAFLKAFRLLKGFRGDSAFSTWLYRVTSSVCLTEIKRRQRRGEVALEARHTEEGVEPAIEQEDLYEQIRRCVTRLPERYAMIVTLYYLQGLSYEEVAEIMDIPLGTLKTWMFRARKELKRLVERDVLPYAQEN